MRPATIGKRAVPITRQELEQPIVLQTPRYFATLDLITIRSRLAESIVASMTSGAILLAELQQWVSQSWPTGGEL